MDDEKFSAILPILVADFACLLSERRGLSTDEALSVIYGSKLYAYLSDERTKVWHFSSHALLDFLEMEERDGVIDFPEC